MECLNPDCREDVPDHLRFCVVCGADAKVPNVRAASHAEEIQALEQRVLQVERDAASGGYEKVLEDFREAVSNSSAVICRSLGVLSALLSSDNQLFATFYQGINGDARLPEGNEWDRIRQSVDSLIFPYYYEHIRFASLSLNRCGITGYGDFCVVLKEVAIRDRTSVFEENAILFAKKHRIVAGDEIPSGYRATWMNRDLLAVAKLSYLLTPTTTQADYANILASSTATDADFIEVHIYGPIHRRAIEHLSGPQPHHKADNVILKSVLKKLQDIGATFEIF